MPVVKTEPEESYPEPLVTCVGALVLKYRIHMVPHLSQLSMLILLVHDRVGISIGHVRLRSRKCDLISFWLLWVWSYGRWNLFLLFVPWLCFFLRTIFRVIHRTFEVPIPMLAPSTGITYRSRFSSCSWFYILGRISWLKVLPKFRLEGTDMIFILLGPHCTRFEAYTRIF